MSVDVAFAAPTYTLASSFEAWVVVALEDSFVVSRDAAVVVVAADECLRVASVGILNFDVGVFEQTILVAASSYNVLLSQVGSYNSATHSQAQAQRVAELQPSGLALAAHLVPFQTRVVVAAVGIEPLGEAVASVGKLVEECSVAGFFRVVSNRDATLHRLSVRTWSVGVYHLVSASHFQDFADGEEVVGKVFNLLYACHRLNHVQEHIAQGVAVPTVHHEVVVVVVTAVESSRDSHVARIKVGVEVLNELILPVAVRLVVEHRELSLVEEVAHLHVFVGNLIWVGVYFFEVPCTANTHQKSCTKQDGTFDIFFNHSGFVFRKKVSS